MSDSQCPETDRATTPARGVVQYSKHPSEHTGSRRKGGTTFEVLQAAHVPEQRVRLLGLCVPGCAAIGREGEPSPRTDRRMPHTYTLHGFARLPCICVQGSSQEPPFPRQPTLEDCCQIMPVEIDNIIDKHIGMISELYDEMGVLDQLVASLEQDARQPRLDMKADGQADTKTWERTEGAAKAVQAKHGDSCTAQKAQDGPKTSICFGANAEPPAFPYRDDVVVENGVVVPKSCLSPLEMRTTTAGGGLLLTGETSTATRTIFNSTVFWLCQTEETYSEITSIPCAWYDSRFRRNKLLAAPSCRKVVETKSGQNRMFDPGGSEGCLRACPFL